ncbi:MAG: thiamine pyrophosphate-binding protein [Anaerolineales bacterium]|nr:thiamine pyrophosphate-binding protein [Anaerolineales bacterium]
MSTVADLFADHLAMVGINVVFGLPGGENLALVGALGRRGIRFVLVRNESSAVYMAGVTARLTGKPGVCLVTLGPGAANAMAGVAHAWLDRDPVLVMTADFPETVVGKHTHQVLDLAALFRPVTKVSIRLPTLSTGMQLRAALMLTYDERPGPVHLSLIASDADAKAGMTVPQREIFRAFFTAPEAVAAGAAVLREARRPLILAGLGLEPEGPYAELRELAEGLNAPVVDTPKARGSLPADHPLYGGTIGLMQSDPAYALLDDADCFIAVGFDVVELVRQWDYDKPLIWVANWPNEDPVIPAAATLVGSIKDSLRQLIDTECETEADWGAARVARFRQDTAAPARPEPPAGRLYPQQLLAVLHEALPAQTAIATDVGSHKILTALSWPATTPNRYFVSNGLSAMGFGLPAAIAAALVLGEPTVCVTGDAGFAMVMGELALIQELDLPVLVVVMNDAALDLIRSKQQRRAEPVCGTEFSNPDFAAIAQAYGLPYYRVDSETAARTALAAAVATGRAALIEALIDPSSYPTAPGQSGLP